MLLYRYLPVPIVVDKYNNTLGDTRAVRPILCCLFGGAPPLLPLTAPHKYLNEAATDLYIFSKMSMSLKSSWEQFYEWLLTNLASSLLEAGLPMPTYLFSFLLLLLLRFQDDSKTKEDRIETCLAQTPVNLWELRELALSKGGLLKREFIYGYNLLWSHIFIVVETIRACLCFVLRVLTTTSSFCPFSLSRVVTYS